MRIKRTKRPRFTRIQKEARIIQLHEDGYNVSEICSIVGCSATTATEVINRDEKSREPKEKSKRSQALILFDNPTGSSILNVATQIDIPILEAQDYFREYQNAKGIDYLEQLRGIMGQSFHPFISLCKEMYLRKVSPSEIEEVRNLLPQKKTIESELVLLHKEQILVSDDLRVKRGLKEFFGGLLNTLKEDVRVWQKDHDDLLLENKTLTKRNSDLVSIIQSNIDSSEVCKKVDDFTRKQIKSILNDQQRLIILILTAMVQVLRHDTAKEFKNLVYPPFENYLDIPLINKFADLLIRVVKQIEPQVMMAIRNDQYKQVKEIVDSLNSERMKVDLDVAKDPFGSDNHRNGSIT